MPSRAPHVTDPSPAHRSRASARASGIVAFACALLAAPACRPRPDHAPAPPVATPGEVLLEHDKIASAGMLVDTVDEQSVEDTIVTSGVVTFADTKVAHVYSPVNGRVTEIFAELGQHVKKGQPLAAIQSPDIGQAVSDVHKAEADLIAAEHDYKRQKDLEKQRAAATRDVEASEDRYRQAKAELERAQAKARLLRTGAVNTVTQTYTLAAQIDGEVMMRAVSPGMEVAGQYASGSALELFTVGEIDHVWALGDVYEMDIPRIHAGASASIDVVSYKDRHFEGRVEWIQHVLDPATRTAKVRFSFDNPGDALLPQMYGTVRIHVDQRRALAIPRSAILRLGDQRVVFVDAGAAPDGRERFVRVPVDVDEYGSDHWLPVRRGLDKGARVVTRGAVLLSEL